MIRLSSIASLAAAALALSSCAAMPVGNSHVPPPAKSVDIAQYAGLWYEIGRYNNGFESGCEAVTAEYSVRDDDMLSVLNICHKGTPTGPAKAAKGRAKVVAGSQNAKLKVSFFGPFFGDYWVLDHADDYSWSIVGEPSGRYLWLLSRDAHPSDARRKMIEDRAQALGYNLGLLYRTRQ